MAEFLAMCRVENPEIGDFVAWIAFSGLRLSGAAGLRWEEIDFAASRFRRIMKGGAEVYIPLLPEAADLLRARWERQAFPSAGAVWQFSDRRIKAVRRVMRKFADGLGLDLRYPHALRHHFASVALAAGLSAAEVARMLGHRDGGALVLRTYAHVVRDVLHQKVSQLRIGAAV
jgi:integrase